MNLGSSASTSSFSFYPSSHSNDGPSSPPSSNFLFSHHPPPSSHSQHQQPSNNGAGLNAPTDDGTTFFFNANGMGAGTSSSTSSSAKTRPSTSSGMITGGDSHNGNNSNSSFGLGGGGGLDTLLGYGASNHGGANRPSTSGGLMNTLGGSNTGGSKDGLGTLFGGGATSPGMSSKGFGALSGNGGHPTPPPTASSLSSVSSAMSNSTTTTNTSLGSTSFGGGSGAHGSNALEQIHAALFGLSSSSPSSSPTRENHFGVDSVTGSTGSRPSNSHTFNGDFSASNSNSDSLFHHLSSSTAKDVSSASNEPNTLDTRFLPTNFGRGTDGPNNVERNGASDRKGVALTTTTAMISATMTVATSGGSEDALTHSTSERNLAGGGRGHYQGGKLTITGSSSTNTSNSSHLSNPGNVSGGSSLPQQQSSTTPTSSTFQFQFSHPTNNSQPQHPRPITSSGISPASNSSASLLYAPGFSSPLPSSTSAPNSSRPMTAPSNNSGGYFGNSNIKNNTASQNAPQMMHSLSAGSQFVFPTDNANNNSNSRRPSSSGGLQQHHHHHRLSTTPSAPSSTPSSSQFQYLPLVGLGGGAMGGRLPDDPNQSGQMGMGSSSGSGVGTRIQHGANSGAVQGGTQSSLHNSFSAPNLQSLMTPPSSASKGAGDGGGGAVLPTSSTSSQSPFAHQVPPLSAPPPGVTLPPLGAAAATYPAGVPYSTNILGQGGTSASSSMVIGPSSANNPNASSNLTRPYTAPGGLGGARPSFGFGGAGMGAGSTGGMIYAMPTAGGGQAYFTTHPSYPGHFIPLTMPPGAAGAGGTHFPFLPHSASAGGAFPPYQLLPLSGIPSIVGGTASNGTGSGAAGTGQKKRARRRYDEIERLYKCNYEGCTKAYGTLNHLNAHVSMQKHGKKRVPSEFKDIRKAWKNRQKARAAADSASGHSGKDGDKKSLIPGYPTIPGLGMAGFPPIAGLPPGGLLHHPNQLQSLPPHLAHLVPHPFQQASLAAGASGISTAGSFSDLHRSASLPSNLTPGLYATQASAITSATLPGLSATASATSVTPTTSASDSGMFSYNSAGLFGISSSSSQNSVRPATAPGGYGQPFWASSGRSGSPNAMFGNGFGSNPIFHAGFGAGPLGGKFETIPEAKEREDSDDDEDENDGDDGDEFDPDEEDAAMDGAQ